MEKGKNSTKEKTTNSPRSPIGLKHSLKSNTHMYVVLCWCYQKLIVSIMNHCLTAAGGLIFPDWSSSLKFGTCTERIYTFPFMCSNIKPADFLNRRLLLSSDEVEIYPILRTPSKVSLPLWNICFNYVRRKILKRHSNTQVKNSLHCLDKNRKDKQPCTNTL